MERVESVVEVGCPIHTEQEPDKRISWKSVSGAPNEHQD
jgi:hypothetical protein